MSIALARLALSGGSAKDPGAAASPALPAEQLVEPAAPQGRKLKGFTKSGEAAFGGAYRDRTDDLLNAIQSLSQLS